MRIGITLTSSLDVGQEYIDLTKIVAGSLAQQGFGIVYGGTDYGMMATLAKSYKEAGGNSLTGVMAKDLKSVTKNYIAYAELDQSFLEETMEDRKRRIIQLSDAFIILPGGYGTFEEIGSIVGGKANKLFDKPIAIYNYNGFYDTLLKFLDEMCKKQFSKIPIEKFILVSEDLDEIIGHFRAYQPTELVDKFA
jgi:uncharacterized protein (TIGR00730 family)